MKKIKYLTYLKSDCLKTNYLSIRAAHLFIPIVAVLVLASAILGIAFLVVLGNNLACIDFYLFASIIMLGSSIPMYILHLFLSFEFNKGVSIDLGIVEILVSALFLTGLENSIWKYVLASWPARITTTFFSTYNGDIGASADLN